MIILNKLQKKASFKVDLLVRLTKKCKEYCSCKYLSFEENIFRPKLKNFSKRRLVGAGKEEGACKNNQPAMSKAKTASRCV